MPERRQFTLILSITLYIVSMFFVALYVDFLDAPDINGYRIFALGVELQYTNFSFASFLIFVIWLANPILWLAWVYIKQPKKAYYLSLASSLLSFSFIFWDLEYMVLGPGYFIWLSSSLIVVIGSLSMLKIVKGSK